MRAILVAAALVLAGCSSTVQVGQWQATCRGVTAEDCAGIARLFIGNLARNDEGIREESGGRVSIEPIAACPPLPDWAAPGACWRASAPTKSVRACMVIARQRGGTNETSDFGQVGGDNYTGNATAAGPGTTPC
jgi:hypothetical protein